MRKILLMFLLIINAFIVSGLNEAGSKIVVYREQNLYGSAISYKILLNDSLIIKIRNNTYYEHYCYPGEYVIQVDKYEETKLTLDVKEGETYYLKFGLRAGFWKNIPELILVDSLSAKKAIDSGTMKKFYGNAEDLIRAKNRITLDLRMGFGTEEVPMILFENGDESTISFGGGFGIGLSYGKEINRYFDVAFDLNYAYSCLVPYVKNADVTFSRISTKITPSLIIPIDGGYSLRLKLGPGIGVYYKTKLKLEMNELQDGFNDTWYYNYTLGLHGRIIFEFSPSEKWTLAYGLTYYYVNYNYDYSKGNSYPTEKRLIEANGSGIDLICQIQFNF